MPHRHGHAHRVHAGDPVISGISAAWYDTVLSRFLLRGIYRAMAARLAERLPADSEMLDVGTGPGRLLLDLASRRPDLRLVGIDPSADMVRRAQDHVRGAGFADRVEMRQASAEELPFDADRFTAVVSTLSGHHWADPVAAVAEQVRVLRPGGELWMVDMRRHESADAAAALADRLVEIAPLELSPWLRRMLVVRTASKSADTAG